MTIKDIAAKCGVSVTTVSRVINNQPYVKEDIRERVLHVIEEEHFIPHAGAVNLVKSTENTIGLVVRGRESAFLDEMIPLIEKVVADRGYSFSLTQVHSNDDELKAAAQFAKSERLKGIILLGGRADYTPKEIEILDVPFVCCTFTNTTGSLERSSYCSVSIDDVAVARWVTDYLIELGHRNIAILGARDDENSIGELRHIGYRQALEAHGIPYRDDLVMMTGTFRMDDAYTWTKRLAERNQEFTALFAISDAQAAAAMKALSDCGRRIPEDCSVIGIDGLEITKYFIPSLTTMVQPKEEIAVKSVDLLIDVINGKPAAQIFIAPIPRQGESTSRNNGAG